MPHCDPGNRVSPAELRALLERSQLSSRSFARLLGLPAATFSDMVAGRSRPTLAVLNGARFVMLRLGHSVEIRPFEESLIQKARQ